MQEVLLWLETWFRQKRDVVACLVMSTMTLPMLLLFIFMPWFALRHPEWRSIYVWNTVVMVQVVLVACALVLTGIALFSWLRRFSQRDFPALTALTVCISLTAIFTLNYSYGYKDSPLMLLGLGMMILVRALFKPKIYKPMVFVLLFLFGAAEVGFWTGSLSYAPILRTPIYTGADLLPWWSFWLRIIFVLIALPMVALFFIHGYFMRKEKRALEQLAITDSLTGISNRSYFMARLEIEGRRHARKDLPMCILMCDVDNFKRVNDAWGHAMGDDVLRAIGNILNQSVRSHHDVAARIGGEEFAVLLANMHLPQAKRVAEKIRQHLSHHIFGNAEESFQVTFSIGVAQVDNGDGARGLKLADDYLYKAKEEGRNRVAAMQLVPRATFSDAAIVE
ncbi:GGDEF domain-containing protein [Ketobacter sp. MCCC 1A13808]|uniref:GGDEF domain-containing protein n=1 Tax=Ketobacter sp. MCCC 1A13808 TaxID=2602738 RepID=UPI000F124DC2|nr:GGDEF domain-containing protein [Ketobacter sp. MCCC 1A13808]MVF13123.1 GGDEF domain-containing protein [Ketobacter sp. MCCC 1A13808]RLP54770.1 MAG: GGDEF domain-containing protein [Ketobacter sp.]